MRTHRTVTLLTAAGILTLTACNPQAGNSTGQPAPITPITPSTQPAAPSSAAPAPASKAPAAPAPASPAAPVPAAPVPAAQATVPNMVGKILQTAQDEAQAAGFYLLGSTDATGQSRMQVLDRNWKVCSQTPAAGTKADPSSKLVFNTVKVGETCP
ncbi:PASTA domain-containing protein [Streptomyces sp. APSN-46.1]|uniref:PASTA domain-containing protein n=1 Tax=Streptomyces sp. APSN-46.1 TaxID=2929049 RepID=UPI001FB510E7|nr:PASTA domain-containing protein [Streptomyces sp. APSN-46.1]MCJ1678384.1 PASTA domain-containing protein [Streptomyces sp. APSN-46.1]